MSKFKRTNYLTQNIRTYRTHFIDITLTYAYEFDDLSVMDGMEADTTFLDAWGDFTYTYSDTGTVYSVRIKGRFYEVPEDALTIDLNLPVPINGAGVITDDLPLEVKNEFFWSKNDIRIPIDILPTVPVILWAETYYMSGEFISLASINVLNVAREGKYWLDLNGYLDAWLERDMWKDFKTFWETTGQGIYKYAIRRFRITHSSDGLGTDELALQFYNCFTVIYGQMDKADWMRSVDQFGLVALPMSWKPPGTVAPIGKLATVPFSFMDSQNLVQNDIVVTENGVGTTATLYSNSGETVVGTYHTERYIFLVVTYDGGTRVYFTERGSICFRVCDDLPGVTATHAVVTESTPYTPTVWLFGVDTDAELTIWKVAVGMFYKTEPIKIKVKKPVAGETWEWVCVCSNFTNTGVAGLVRRTGEDENIFVTLTSADVDLDEDMGVDLAGLHAQGMTHGDSGADYVAVFAEGTAYESNDTGATWAINSHLHDEINGWTRNSIKWVAADRYLIWGEGGDLVGRLYYERPSDSTRLGLYNFTGGWQDVTLVEEGADKVVTILYNMNQTMTSPVDDTGFVDDVERVFFPTADDYRNLISGPGKHGALGIFTDRWEHWSVTLPDSDAQYNKLLKPIYYYYLKQSAVDALTEAMNLSFTYNGNPDYTGVFKFDGKYQRQERYLFFRTLTGAFEILQLQGEAETDMTSKKLLSSRFTDQNAQFEAGEDFVAWIDEASERLSVNTGWLKKTAYAYFLKELNLTKEAYLVEAGVYVPVNVQVSKAQPVQDKPDAYSLEVVLSKSWQKI